MEPSNCDFAGNDADDNQPRSKRPRKRLCVNVTVPSVNFTWVSKFNLEGKVTQSQVEIGDGATSRVYIGDMNGEQVAVKQLKCYSPRLAPSLIKSYEPLFNLQHPNIVRVLGVCPQAGFIVLEYCEKRLGQFVLHTLGDLLLHLGNALPQELQLNALADIAEGLDYMHKQGVVHGDIKPANVLVCGYEENEYNFKLTDYSCNNTAAESALSRSSCLRQLMTPGYVAPELFGSMGNRLQPTTTSDIYSFGILAYEIAFQKEAWSNVSFQLISAVKSGYRPVIPGDVSQVLTPLITLCWQQDDSLRPCASRVLQRLEEIMNSLIPSSVSKPLEVGDFSTIADVSTSEPVSIDDMQVNLNDSCDSQVTLEDEQLQVEVADDSQCESTASVHDNSDGLHLSHVESSASSEECISSVATNEHGETLDLEAAKSTLKIHEFKQFQTDCIAAVTQGKDVIVVQPTGSGKSMCFVLPALLFKGKISLVIEPVVAVIVNQVDALQKKGINALALGRAAGSKKSLNFRKIFHSTLDEPVVAFCTPEYLFGTPSTGSCLGTVGQFSTLLAKKDCVGIITIDEAHKIFDRLPSYHPAFDDLKKLKQMSCPIIAMSATLTSEQISLLQESYLHSNNTVILKEVVHRNNIKLQLQRYKRCKQDMHIQYVSDDEDENNDDDVICTGSSSSMWLNTVGKIKTHIEDHGSVVYLDFVKDVEEVLELLKQGGFKVGKYTGQMTVEDRRKADRQLLSGELSVLVATESFELGVDNPNINQVVRIGCPRNLSVLLQEIGRAGRQKDSIANGLLLFNESIDDKRLGLWLKSSLNSSDESSQSEKVRNEMLTNYAKTWRFIYALYHGKCLSWALSHFYADDQDPPTCFVANNPLCSVCEESETICQETVDIQQHLVILLKTMQTLAEYGLEGATKTLITAVLMKTNEQYVRKYEQLHEIFDASDSLWGCGKLVNGTMMSCSSWHKVLYVAVHIGFLDLRFYFRPFDSHYEVHRRYCIAPQGTSFLSNQHSVMSVDPQSSVTDLLLGSVFRPPSKRINQKRGTQLKPRIIDALQKPYVIGSIEQIKYIGFGEKESEDICLYFEDVFTMKEGTKDPHFLLDCMQLSRTQSSVSEVSVNLDGVITTLKVNRSYCSGVKVCGGEGCSYTVSTKQRVNRCSEHKAMGLILSGPCNCHLAYVYPSDELHDGRRWVIALNAANKGNLHNHNPPAEWRILPNVIKDISNTASLNSHLAPKKIQKGSGMTYQPMSVSLAAANIDRVRAVVKKAKKEVDKIDNDRVNPFKIIASFPSIKLRIDGNAESLDMNQIRTINALVGNYQLDGDSAYSFGRDRQYAFFQSPFQACEWANAEVLFVDIDYTGCSHFKYLFNVVCLNSVTKKYMACGRALLNHQDGHSIGKALNVLVNNVKKQQHAYNIQTSHKEILLDFDDAEANAFQESFGEDIMRIIRGCYVHFLRSAMRVAKVVNSSVHSVGYRLFMSISKRIPDEPSRDVVMEAFDILSGQKSFMCFAKYLPSDLSSLKSCEIDTTNWKSTTTWVDWWKRPQVLRKLCKAYSNLEDDDWDDLPGTTNPVESINRQSVPGNAKTVSLKPLIEHFYLEDKRHAILQVACNANITISYHTKQRQRSRRPPKAPEKVIQLVIPTGKRAIGMRLSVEFYSDDSKKTTTWYKGTVISYSRQNGYVISFDGYGPEDNETIKSLKKAAERNEIKIL